LGSKYQSGNGATRDYTQAHMWFKISATQGNESACDNRDVVARQMTPEQIAEAERLARLWLATLPVGRKQ